MSGLTDAPPAAMLPATATASPLTAAVSVGVPSTGSTLLAPPWREPSRCFRKRCSFPG